MASLNVAAIFPSSGAAAVPLSGFVALTVGLTASDTVPVVKVHTYSCGRGFPDKSAAPVVIVAVYSVS